MKSKFNSWCEYMDSSNFLYGQTPRTVKTKTIREYEYDTEGRVVKETITIEETKYENGTWSQPYIYTINS